MIQSHKDLEALPVLHQGLEPIFTILYTQKMSVPKLCIVDVKNYYSNTYRNQNFNRWLEMFLPNSFLMI
jgi:hypothetical protein